MSNESLIELSRQTDICNACRYCESYCSVFPAMHREQSLADADLTQLANLCVNCRGCFYACQYTAPHEFDINLPKALAEVRRESWEDFAWPKPLSKAFHTQAFGLILALALGTALIFAFAKTLGNLTGSSFYDVMSHTLMISLFLPAFFFPAVSLFISLRRYWKHVGGGKIHMAHIKSAFADAAKMKDLAAGHGQGCNFEDEDRFSQARRHAHHAIMYGFLLCIASTTSGTILHYIFNQPAPYGFLSIPKLLGVPGGLVLTVGCVWMISLKLRSDKTLGDRQAWNSDIIFTALLGFVAFSGLVLWVFGQTPATAILLILHLGAVLAFFIVTPFSKMAHGFYRLAAMIREAQNK